MKKVAIMLAAGLLLAAVLPAYAQSRRSPAKLTRMEGWVVDQWGGAKNAHAEAKARILENHEKGAALVFVSNAGTIYSLHDQEKALDNVGFEVRVVGSVDDDNNLNVGTYVRVEHKKKSEPDS